MGSWSEDIFGNDLAADVRGIYHERLKAGDSIDHAVKCVRHEFSDPMRDADDRRTVWIALAAAQVQKGEISDAVRKQAVTAIAWCEAPDRDPESYPFGLKALVQLRKNLGGKAPASAKPAKPKVSAGVGGEVLAVTLPTAGGEAVIYIAGPAGNDRGPDAGRIVLLMNLAPDAVTEASTREAQLAWRKYYQRWDSGHVGRGIGCYDANGKLPARRTRMLLRGVKMPSTFARRMRGTGAIYQSAVIPWVVERDLEEWQKYNWIIDPKDRAKK